MLQRIIRSMIIIWLFATFTPFSAMGQDRRQLGRKIDPVVIVGKTTPALLGQPIERIGFFAVHDGALIPIPFQIDEKTSSGNYAYAVWNGERIWKDDGKLDANDEIVFMALDVGGKFNGEPWPDNADIGVKIAVEDPVDGSVGYVYAFAFSQDAPTTDKDYVTYHVNKNEIESNAYLVGYDPKAPIAIGKLIIKKGFGGSGVSVADRLKIRISAKARWGLFEIDRNEEDFLTEVVAYTDGPVRVIRRTRAWQELLWNIPTPSSYQDSTYYWNQMLFPITIELPFDISAFFTDVSMRVTVDTPPAVKGRKYYNERNPQGVLIDGHMSQREKNLDKGEFNWQVIAGSLPEHPEGWISRQIITSNNGDVNLPLYYMDDMNMLDEPENMPGSFGNLGFCFYGIQKMKKGSMNITVQQFPAINYKPGDEKKYMEILDHPLVVTSTQISQ